MTRGSQLYAFFEADETQTTTVCTLTSDLTRSEAQGRNSFKSNVHHLLGPSLWLRVYHSIFDMFECLPLAALVSDKILVLHGGIGDGTWGLDHLRTQISRPLAVAQEPFIKACLWSDPSDSDADMAHGVMGFETHIMCGGRASESWNG